MEGKTPTEKIHSLSNLVAALTEQLNGLGKYLEQLATEHSQTVESLGDSKLAQTRLEGQVAELLRWKSEMAAVAELKTEVAILRREVDKLEKVKEEWGRRLWAMLGPILGAAVGWDLGYLAEMRVDGRRALSRGDVVSPHDNDGDRERFVRRDGPSPTGRVYVHERCGGQTRVSGGDYTHICDPFWPCTSTYCCGCSGFVSLHEVRWADTGEPISEYRSRLRAETPGFLKAWRYGLGFLMGGAVGMFLGLLIALIARAPGNRMVGFVVVGGLAGAVVCYLIGTIVLNRALGVDYRRMR